MINNPTTTVKNFTISLYAFHLRHTLTDAPNEVDANANLLWENLAKLGTVNLPFSGLNNLHSKLICYQNGNYEPQREKGRQTEWLTDSGSIDLGRFPTTEGFKIQGNLQPFRLHDTYAVDLTLSPESPQISIDVPQLQLFKPASLLPTSIQASLGQTIWIYGEVEPSEDCQQLAEKLAVAFLAGTPSNPVLVNQDKLFGSLLFEYQTVDPDNSPNPAKQCQIMVLLNNSQADTLTKAGQAYDWLLKLLASYHKILYIYPLARERYAQARSIYCKLDRQMRDFPTQIADPKTRLKNLNKLLTNLPLDAIDYNSCLGDIKAHHTAITTNTTNYRTCLEKIAAIGDCPKFWQDFLDRTCNQWQAQIQIDLDYLSPGQDLFGQMVDTIRGVVETEQAESDRAAESTAQKRQQRLELLITVASTGLAVSGISSQVANEPAKTILTQLFPAQFRESSKPESLSYLVTSFSPIVFHLLVGVIFAIPLGGIVWGIQTDLIGKIRRFIKKLSNRHP
jgi:hypothetical protein